MVLNTLQDFSAPAQAVLRQFIATLPPRVAVVALADVALSDSVIERGLRTQLDGFQQFYVKPLRERRRSVVPFACAVLGRLSGSEPPTLDDASAAALESFEWRSNELQLRAFAEQLWEHVGGDLAGISAATIREVAAHRRTEPAASWSPPEASAIAAAPSATGRQTGLSRVLGLDRAGGGLTPDRVRELDPLEQLVLLAYLYVRSGSWAGVAKDTFDWKAEDPQTRRLPKSWSELRNKFSDSDRWHPLLAALPPDYQDRVRTRITGEPDPAGSR